MKTGKTLCLGTLFLAACGLMGTAQAAPNWTAVNHAVNEDDTSSVLWDRADGAATVWQLSQYGQTFTSSAVFGPYTGWHASHVVAIDDNIMTPEILWNRSDGAMSVFTLSTDSQSFTSSAVFGPYPGWTARSMGTDDAGATDLTHVLWTNANGAMAVWTLSADQQSFTSSTVFGPITGWNAADIAVEDSGVNEVLWTRSDGAAAVWTVAADGQSFTTSAVFGPYTNWAAKGVTVNCEDGSATSAATSGPIEVLWNRSDGAATVTNLSTDGQSFTASGIFGPFAGWSAQDVSVQEDGTAQMLWFNTSGQMNVYTLSADQQTYTPSKVFGPY